MVCIISIKSTNIAYGRRTIGLCLFLVLIALLRQKAFIYVKIRRIDKSVQKFGHLK